MNPSYALDPVFFSQDRLLYNTFYSLYHKYGSTCLNCCSLNTPVRVINALNPYRILQHCETCNTTVGHQFLQWEQTCGERLVWKTGTHGSYITNGQLSDFTEIVPVDFLCFELSPTAFTDYLDLIKTQSTVENLGSLYFLRSFVAKRLQCVNRVKRFCQRIRDLNVERGDCRLADYLENHMNEYNLLSWNQPSQEHPSLSENELFLSTSLIVPSEQMLDCTSCKIENVHDNLLLQVNNRCNICFTDFIDEKKMLLVINSCKHVFHNDCVLPWLRQNQTCPLCRRKL